ncbi:MAG TPA: cache domain-containing protein [Methanoregulaceae archaeon]|nr:cache domain-containing protein [Methanoregulaceae archaeon]
MVLLKFYNRILCVALPFQPEYIGTNRLDFADTYGVEILRWKISAAKRGGGFVYVQYLNPDTGDAGMKLCYVAPVDDEWFVGSGIYTEAV